MVKKCRQNNAKWKGEQATLRQHHSGALPVVMA